jgi:hypothetical protein
MNSKDAYIIQLENTIRNFEQQVSKSVVHGEQEKLTV